MELEKRRERSRIGSAPLCKLRESRGDFTLNGAFLLLLVIALLVLFISVLGVVNDAMKLHSVTAELVRYIEIRGKVDSQVYNELDRLSDVAGIEIDSYDIDATYFAGQKVQFGTSFDVTLTASGEFGLGGVLAVRVPLTSTVSGRSEQYWR